MDSARIETRRQTFTSSVDTLEYLKDLSREH